MRSILSIIKPYLRWVIFGATLFFVLKAFKDNWNAITSVSIDSRGWSMLAIALLVTLAAHTWSGWVWTWILQAFQQPIDPRWALQVYLKTNIAKYLPGNVWHFYGRITAISQAGCSLGVASLSVLLEPLLMAAAALIIALTSSSIGLIKVAPNISILALQIACAIAVLVAIHPFIINKVIYFLSKSKLKGKETKIVRLESYPILPLLGESGFLILRGTGFVFTLWPLVSIDPSQIPQLISAFSFAWLLGLVVPGAPGGLGVFEAVAIALLDKQFSAAMVLSVALFRLVSILAEAIAAGFAWLTMPK